MKLYLSVYYNLNSAVHKHPLSQMGNHSSGFHQLGMGMISTQR